MTVEYQS